MTLFFPEYATLSKPNRVTTKHVNRIFIRKDFLCSGWNSQQEKTYFIVSDMLRNAADRNLDSLSQSNIPLLPVNVLTTGWPRHRLLVPSSPEPHMAKLLSPTWGERVECFSPKCWVVPQLAREAGELPFPNCRAPKSAPASAALGIVSWL